MFEIMDVEKKTILERLSQAVKILEECPEFAIFIPEVRTNIVYALPNASTPMDVAGVDGRITVVSGRPKAAGPVKFGASDHLARFVIELGKFDRRIRSAVNFRDNERIKEFVYQWANECKKRIGIIDRGKEPPEVIGKDGMSSSWKAKELISATGGKLPEVVYETRGWGKESLFILLGEEPIILANSLVNIAREFSRLNL